MNCSTPGLPVHHQLQEFTQTRVHRVDDAIQPSHPLSSSSPPATNPSQHQSLFQWVNSSHQVAKVLEFQFQHQSFQCTPRADLLAVQGTLKSLLQHHSSKASVLQHSAFFTVQLSHPYMTTGKTIVFIDYAKAFDCVDHNKLWKILKGMGIPDHLTCLLRNLHAGQEATVRTGHGTTDWFQIGKGVWPGCILSPCLFNLYAEYIMRNSGLGWIFS